MIIKNLKFLLVIIIGILFMQCSVSKRHYRKGYHVAWHHNKTNESEGISKKEHRQEKIKTYERELDQVFEQSQDELVASVENVKEIVLKKNKANNFRLPNDSCPDVIVFRDGSEINVKIAEIFNGTIKYLPCDNLSGPLRVTNGDKVFMIKYANGTKEVFKEESKVQDLKSYNPNNPNQRKELPKQRKLNLLALFSFLCACTFFFYITAFAAVILGLIALNQFSKYPDRYKGKWMAKVGIIAGSILSFYIILYLASI